MATPLRVGRYALHGEIASGGMAVLHLGRLLGQAGFARTVAIKRLHAHLARDPEFVAMFLDEARIAARVRHPNVVSTLDVVATAGELFVVMEYVHGDSLARLLRAAALRGERVPPPIAASIMVNVLYGLHAAHEACDERGKSLELVHRDVSPQNVLVGADGAAHVIDFGIAKAAGRAQVTREGQLKGKLAYMAPEQLRGAGVDRRADVFGASVVFWEMLTGERLFDGDDEGVIYGKVLRADVKRPSKRAAGIGRAIDAIVLRGLARDPERRFATAAEMATAIEAKLALARQSQVGQWVESLMAETLAERRRAIAAIESSVDAADSVSGLKIPPRRESARNIATAPGGRFGLDDASLVATAPLGPIAPGDEGSPMTDTSLVASELARSPPPETTRWRAVLLGALGVALLAGASLLAARGAADRPPVRVESRAPPRASATVRDAPPAASASAIAAEPPAVAPESLPLAPPPDAKNVRPRATRRAPSAPAAARATSAPDCNPPYTLDADGNRKYKRECATW